MNKKEFIHMQHISFSTKKNYKTIIGRLTTTYNKN